MNRIIEIFFLICASVLLSAKSCSEQSAESPAAGSGEIIDTFRLVKTELEAETLSELTLSAFEARAKQEITEFADYLHIYSDSSLDTSFRQQAGEMIEDLFISDTLKLSFYDASGKKLEFSSITQLLKEMRSKAKKPINFSIDSMVISYPLKRTGGSRYQGTVRFDQEIAMQSLIDTSHKKYIQMNMDFYAARSRKSFGIDTMDVWQVFLGGTK